MSDTAPTEQEIDAFITEATKEVDELAFDEPESPLRYQNTTQFLIDLARIYTREWEDPKGAEIVSRFMREMAAHELQVL